MSSSLASAPPEGARSERVSGKKRKRFFDLADRLARSSDAKEHERLKDELARMTFGE